MHNAGAREREPGRRAPSRSISRTVIYDNGFHDLVVQGLAVLVPERPKIVNDRRNAEGHFRHYAYDKELDDELTDECPTPI